MIPIKDNYIFNVPLLFKLHFLFDYNPIFEHIYNVMIPSFPNIDNLYTIVRFKVTIPIL